MRVLPLLYPASAAYHSTLIEGLIFWNLGEKGMGIEFNFKVERHGKNAELMFRQFSDFYCCEIEEFRDYIYRFLNPDYKKDGVEFIKNLKHRLEIGRASCRERV